MQSQSQQMQQQSQMQMQEQQIQMQQAQLQQQLEISNADREDRQAARIEEIIAQGEVDIKVNAAKAGNDVTKTCIVNDRGVHICKSMIAWQMFANGETPNSTNTKGDHFVGKYYVKFNDVFKDEVKALIEEGIAEKDAEKQAPIMQKTQQMLVD
jgi:predicted phosphoribosyltransferase